MNLSDMLVQADLILPPDEAELALLPLICTVNQFQVSCSIVFVGKFPLTHETPPGGQIFVPGQVFVQLDTFFKLDT